MLLELSEDDCDALEACSQASFLTAVDPPWKAEVYRRFIAGGALGWKMGGREDGIKLRSSEEIMRAFILLQNSIDVLEIFKLAVRPEWRRRGWGKQLLMKAQAEAKAREVPLLLEVAENNEAAQNLYRQNGFKEIARRPRYYASSVDALVFQWTPFRIMP